MKREGDLSVRGVERQAEGFALCEGGECECLALEQAGTHAHASTRRSHVAHVCCSIPAGSTQQRMHTCTRCGVVHMSLCSPSVKAARLYASGSEHQIAVGRVHTHNPQIMCKTTAVWYTAHLPTRTHCTCTAHALQQGANQRAHMRAHTRGARHVRSRNTTPHA